MVKLLSLSLLISLFFITLVHSKNEKDEISNGDLNRLHSFEQWQRIYGKSYSPCEKKLRKKIFDEGTAAIIEHNKRYKKGEVTFFLGQNQFSDLTNDEFKKLMFKTSYKDFNVTNVVTSAKCRVKRQAELPASYDYRPNYVTPVQDQGKTCGACYAFASIAAVESQILKKGYATSKLSEQEIVDCTMSYGNNNCGGGMAANAFSYMKSIYRQLSSSSVYPYKGVTGICKAPVTNPASKFRVTTYYKVNPNEDSLKNALYTKGPIVIALQVAGFQNFQFYAGGVFSDPNCSNIANDANHEMLLVGYGTSNDNENFWTLKNSWSTSWGMNGYMKIFRGANMCGIANWPIYPAVALI